MKLPMLRLIRTEPNPLHTATLTLRQLSPPHHSNIPKTAPPETARPSHPTLTTAGPQTLPPSTQKRSAMPVRCAHCLPATYGG